MSKRDAFICPHCDALVPGNARACPECGSDEETGWSDDAKLNRLGIPTQSHFSDEDYNDILPGRPRIQRKNRTGDVIRIALIVLLLAVFLYYFVL